MTSYTMAIAEFLPVSTQAAITDQSSALFLFIFTSSWGWKFAIHLKLSRLVW
jgi:hypothetical protein